MPRLPFDARERFSQLQKDWGSSRQRTTIAESALTALQKEVEVVAAKVSNLEAENATLKKVLET